MTLRTQLSLFASGLVLGTLLLTGLLLTVFERRLGAGDEERRRAARSEELLALARPSAESGAFGPLDDPARALVEGGDADYVWVVDASADVRYERPPDSARHGNLERSMDAVLDALKTGVRARDVRAWRERRVVEDVLPMGKAALVVGYDGEAADRRVRERAAAVGKRMLLAALAPLGAGMLAAALLARRLTRTLDKLASGAQRIGEGHLSARVLTTRADELGELSAEFNAMGRRLEELEELKDSFLAKITHDLRSPLSAVIGYAGLIEMAVDGPVNDKQRRSLRLIVESANYLAELIDNILDLTKMEAGRMRYEPRAVGLRETAGAVAEQLGVKAQEFGVRLDVSGVPQGTSVHADEQALRRLLVNLVSNSLKFTPAGGTVGVEWARTSEGFDRVGVRDTGIGIPPERMALLFTKFGQVPETANKVRAARGTGLGLAICKEIVEAHGGRVWAESEYKKGSVFYFTLPPAPAQPK